MRLREWRQGLKTCLYPTHAPACIHLERCTVVMLTSTLCWCRPPRVTGSSPGSPASLSHLTQSADRMINGQKPQRKRGDAPSVSCVQGQQCSPFWNSLKQASVFGGVLGKAGSWMNCGCYCCVAKPTVMLQIRHESLTPCLCGRAAAHPEPGQTSACEGLFLISAEVRLPRRQNSRRFGLEFIKAAFDAIALFDTQSRAVGLFSAALSPL